MAWDINDPALFNPEHLTVKHMYDNQHAAVVWFGFSKGQSLREHETTSVAIIQVLSGKIKLNTSIEQILEAGQAVALKPSERHALTGLENSVVQLLIVPHPHYHSLSEELDLPSKPKA